MYLDLRFASAGLRKRALLEVQRSPGTSTSRYHRMIPTHASAFETVIIGATTLLQYHFDIRRTPLAFQPNRENIT
jgi:hypothetical protein